MSLNLPDMDIVPECSTEVAGLAFAVSGGDIRSLHASEFFGESHREERRPT
jgi:hypothetical protein